MQGLQHGLVVSALGCCTAAPGSSPARHPTLGPAGRKLFAQMQESLTQLRKKEYPAGEHPEEEYRMYRKKNYKKKECWARHQN
jgi:hypothetical protein